MTKPSLLLLPGLDGTGIMFRPLMAELEGLCDVRALSYPQRADYGYEELTDLVRQLLPKNDFFILGESLSGPIALTIAGEKPDGLRGIILCATFVRNPRSLFPGFLRFLVVPPLFIIWPVSSKLSALTGFNKVRPELRELLRQVKQATSASVLAARTRAVLSVNVSKKLRMCSYPILYLCGTRDIVVLRRNVKSMLRMKPDMEARYLHTSHLVLQEAPHEAAALIKNFIQAHMPGIQAAQPPG